MKRAKNIQSKRGSEPAKGIDAYMDQVPEPYRASLEGLRRLIQSILPDAIEMISYGIPTFKKQGNSIAGFAAFRDHCSYFPFSSRVIPSFKKELISFKTTSGTIHFTPDLPLPHSLVKKLIKARMAEIQAGTGHHSKRKL